MAAIGRIVEIPSGAASQGLVRSSIWSAIHPRLLELIRAHTSALIFVNSRRIAERLAAALNDLPGETLVRSHHGSLARHQRIDVEDQLKAGQLRGRSRHPRWSSIDMGAIDLVIQIEAPTSVASGIANRPRRTHDRRRQPRRDHSEVPWRSHRLRRRDPGDDEARIESTRYPRNPLDVLAQQIVAMRRWRVWASTTCSTRRCRRRSPSSGAARVRGRPRCSPGVTRRTTSPIFGRA
jgi:ATP-dependent Lhr-like helicase